MDTQQPKGRDLAGWVQQLHDEHARWKEEEVSLEALEAFVNTARQVYERAVILKHLAMAEARNQATLGPPVAPTEVAVPETPETAPATAPAEPKESLAEPAVEPLAEPAVEPLAEPAAEPPSSPPAEPARRWTFQPLVSPTEPAPSAPAPAPSAPAPAPSEHAPAPSATAATPSAGGGTSLAQQLKQTGIPALAPALGINDRVRFAGVFASGDVPAFLKFCAEIEALPNLEAAELRLRAAAGPQVDWEDESGTAFAMLQLVKRLRQFLPA